MSKQVYHFNNNIKLNFLFFVNRLDAVSYRIDNTINYYAFVCDHRFRRYQY